jgi:hypothetical protein
VVAWVKVGCGASDGGGVEAGVQPTHTKKHNINDALHLIMRGGILLLAILVSPKFGLAKSVTIKLD